MSQDGQLLTAEVHKMCLAMSLATLLALGRVLHAIKEEEEEGRRQTCRLFSAFDGG